MNGTIDALLKEVAYDSNPYFVALQDGSFDKEDFVETQAQFFFAVDFFSRPMAAVAAKIPNARQRVEVLRNVWEEHGEGDTILTHSETFATFLNRLQGLTPADIEARVLWPEVRVFNTTLAGAAVLDEYQVSVAMMGIVERMFSDISFWIGQAVMKREWISEKEMIHYNLHQDLDIRHSDDFFNVLAPLWDANKGDDRYAIEQGLRLGATVFNGLYAELYRNRHRRWLRTDATSKE